MFHRLFLPAATALAAAFIAFSACSAAQAQITYEYAGPTIVIPTSPNSVGTADPYPARISVGGNGDHLITNLTVTLTNLTHTNPNDLNILLVKAGSSTANTLLMSDAGGTADISNVNLTFSDAGSQMLPDETQISSGTFKPTDYQEDSDAFPAPAPGGPYSLFLSAFNGQLADGDYDLYILDDASLDTGSLSRFSITLTTVVPEPGTFALIASAVVPGIAVVRRRRSRRKS